MVKAYKFGDLGILYTLSLALCVASSVAQGGTSTLFFCCLVVFDLDHVVGLGRMSAGKLEYRA